MLCTALSGVDLTGSARRRLLLHHLLLSRRGRRLLGGGQLLLQLRHVRLRGHEAGGHGRLHRRRVHVELRRVEGRD